MSVKFTNCPEGSTDPNLCNIFQIIHKALPIHHVNMWLVLNVLQKHVPMLQLNSFAPVSPNGALLKEHFVNGMEVAKMPLM